MTRSNYWIPELFLRSRCEKRPLASFALSKTLRSSRPSTSQHPAAPLRAPPRVRFSTPGSEAGLSRAGRGRCSESLIRRIGQYARTAAESWPPPPLLPSSRFARNQQSAQLPSRFAGWLAGPGLAGRQPSESFPHRRAERTRKGRQPGRATSGRRVGPAHGPCRRLDALPVQGQHCPSGAPAFPSESRRQRWPGPPPPARPTGPGSSNPVASLRPARTPVAGPFRVGPPIPNHDEASAHPGPPESAAAEGVWNNTDPRVRVGCATRRSGTLRSGASGRDRLGDRRSESWERGSG